jgi:hypothetical protein
MREAKPYYEAFPAEPISSTAVTRIERAVLVPGMTLDRLLDAILANPPSDRIVLVACHSGPYGLAISLVERSSRRVDSGNLRLLRLGLSADERQAFSADGVSSRQVDDLSAKGARVRQMGIARLEFRGCNLGYYFEPPSALSVFAAFFGGAVASGLDVRSSFGSVDVGSLHATGTPASRRAGYDHWRGQGRNGSAPEEGSSPNRIALACYFDEGPRPLRTSACAESTAACVSWVQSHLPCAPVGRFNPRGFMIHALVGLDATYPFERSRINSAYAGHLKSAGPADLGALRNSDLRGF